MKNMFTLHVKIGRKNLGRKKKMCLDNSATAANLILNTIRPRQTHFFISQKLHAKVSTNFLNDRKFISEFVVTDNILKNFLKKLMLLGFQDYLNIDFQRLPKINRW